MCSTFETGHQLRVLSKNGRYVEKTLKQIKNKQNPQNKQTKTNKQQKNPTITAAPKSPKKLWGKKPCRKYLPFYNYIRCYVTC